MPVRRSHCADIAHVCGPLPLLAHATPSSLQRFPNHNQQHFIHFERAAKVKFPRFCIVVLMFNLSRDVTQVTWFSFASSLHFGRRFGRGLEDRVVDHGTSLPLGEHVDVHVQWKQPTAHVANAVASHRVCVLQRAPRHRALLADKETSLVSPGSSATKKPPRSHESTT